MSNCTPTAATDGLALGLALREAEGDALGDADTEADGLAHGLADGEADGLALGDADGLAEGLGLGLALMDADGLADGDGLGLGDGEADGLGLPLGEADGLALREADGEADGLAEMLADGDALGLGLPLGLPLGEAEGLGLGDALGDADSLALGLGDGLGLGDAEGLADSLADGLALGDGLAEGEADSLADGDGDGLGLGEADGDADSLADADGLALGDADGEPLGLAHDAFTDSSTASYGLKIYESDPNTATSDGFRAEGVQIFNSGGHGFLILDGLNAGTIVGRVHNAAGNGFKAEKLQGCDISKVVSESNYSWGFNLDTCGTGQYAGGLSGGSTDIPNDADFWLEANNWRGSAYSWAGHGTRQFRVRSSAAMKIRGHTGWSSNKCDIDEGSRNNCIFESARWITCANATPLVQLNTGGETFPQDTALAANNNFATIWANPAHRPTVALVGADWEITIPANCFDNAVGSFAYWRPWGLASLFTSQAGDMCSYQVQITADAALAAWCVGREETSNPRQGSDCCEFQVAPVAAGKCWPGLYNVQPRWFAGRVVMGDVRTDVGPSIILWSDGFQNQADYPQNQEMVLTINEWKFYVKRQDGSAV